MNTVSVANSVEMSFKKKKKRKDDCKPANQQQKVFGGDKDLHFQSHFIQIFKMPSFWEKQGKTKQNEG